MSPTEKSTPGSGARKASGRISKTDPTGPFHMTTRRANKNGVFNGSNSGSSSPQNFRSRRESLDGTRPTTSESNASQRSVNNQRYSEEPLPNAIAGDAMNGSSPSAGGEDVTARSDAFSPTEQTPSPYRKRKRSPPPSDEVLDSVVGKHFEAQHSRNEQTSYDQDDTLERVGEDQLSDRVGDDSPPQSSFESHGNVANNNATTHLSTDITPAVSHPGSEATSEPDIEAAASTPLARPLQAALEDVAQIVPNEGEGIDNGEVEEKQEGEVQEEVDGVGEVEEQPDGEGRPRKKFGGRRRAPHPVLKIEVAMRRQAQLKSFFKAMARTQKPVLADVVHQNVQDLEANPSRFEEASEHKDVIAGLEDRLEKRKRQIQAQHALNLQQLQQTREAEEFVLKEKFAGHFKDQKEASLNMLEHKILMVAREAKLQAALHDTEDQDGILLKPKEEYELQSQPDLDTQKAINELDSKKKLRTLMATHLDSLDDEERPLKLEGLTAMDTRPREDADGTPKSPTTTDLLAKAAEEYERIYKERTISNEEAVALQMLGDVAAHPSIPAPVFQRYEPPPSQTQALPHAHGLPPKPTFAQMPPQLLTNHAPSPIPLSMSPRTTQAMGDRFQTRPPPTSPRAAPTLAVRSPEGFRSDRSAVSSGKSGNGTKNVWQSPHSTESRPHSNSNPFPTYYPLSMDLSEPRLPQIQGERRDPRVDISALMSEPTDERRANPPQWREYPQERPSTVLSGGSGQSNPPPAPSSSGPPQPAEGKVKDGAQRGQKRNAPDSTQRNSSGPKRRRGRLSIAAADQANRVSSSSVQDVEHRSPLGDPKLSIIGMPPSPRSQNYPIDLAAEDLRIKNKHDQQDGSRRRSKHMKGNKLDRGGLSRKQLKERHKGSGSSLGTGSSLGSGSPWGTSSSGGTPSVTSTAGGRDSSPMGRGPPAPAPWQGPPPPQHSPLVMPGVPPFGPFHQSSPFGGPAPHHLHHPAYDHMYPNHRNSFPSPQGYFPPGPPQSPLYAVPRAPQPGPPGPQHPGHFSHNLQPPSGFPGFPPTSASSYGHPSLFRGGPAIAPASASLGMQNANFRPAQHPMPAFAQQQQQREQQQQQRDGNARRRAQSDLPKFQAWTPPTGKR